MSARAASAPGAGVLDRLQVLRSAPTPLRGAPAATWTPSPRTGVGPLRVPGPGLQPSSHDTTTTRTDPAGSTLARPDFGPKDGVHLSDTLDFLLRATRDKNAAIAFFRKTVGASHTTPPRVVNVDKNPAYPIAFEAIKHEGFFRPRSSLRQCKYLNNVIEQDHRFIKRRTRPMLGFKQFTTAWRTVRGIEMMHALRKGQARWMAKGDVGGQTRLIHKVFGLAV